MKRYFLSKILWFMAILVVAILWTFGLQYDPTLSQSPTPPEKFRAIDWSSDGQYVATARQDGLIEIWDSTGQFVRSWQAHTPRPTITLAWHPDPASHLLASGGLDYVVRVWDAETGTLVWELTDPNDYVTSVFWNADGSKLGSTNYNSVPNNVIVWDTSGTTPVVDIAFAGGEDLNGGAFSPDGSEIALARSLTLDFWDANSGTFLRSFSEFEGIVTDVDWDANSNLIAASSYDFRVRVYTPSGSLVQTLIGHDHFNVDEVRWSPDGSMLASTSLDGTIRIWDPDTGDTIFIIETADLSFFAWQPNGQLVAFGAEENTFEVICTVAFLRPEDTSIPMMQEPCSTVDSTYSPTYSWWASDGADRYQIVVKNSVETVYPLGEEGIWVEATDVCDGDSCQFQPSNNTLEPDTYSWTIRSYDEDTATYSEWQLPEITFEVIDE